MLILRKEQLVIRSDRLRVDELSIEEGGVLENQGVVHTTTTVSNGTILGVGTLWAWWVTSEFIQGEIDEDQIVIYYGDRPVELSWIQVATGSIIVAPSVYQWSFKD